MLLLSLGGNGGGGGSSREYLGSIIPRYTEATPLITASSTSQYAQPPYSAFDGIESTNLRDPNHAWTSNTGLTNQWIQYHFPEKRYFTKIVIKAFSNYSGDWTGDIKIQGSEDGTVWRDVLENSSTETVTITAKYQEMTTIEIDLNQSLEYNYIRLLGVDALCVDSAPSCFIDDIYVYGGRVVHSSSVLYAEGSFTFPATTDATEEVTLNNFDGIPDLVLVEATALEEYKSEFIYCGPMHEMNAAAGDYWHIVSENNVYVQDITSSVTGIKSVAMGKFTVQSYDGTMCSAPATYKAYKFT